MYLNHFLLALALGSCPRAVLAQESLSPEVHEEYKRIQYAHGIMAALAWVILFPTGAVLLRLFKGRTAVIIHGSWQAFSYAVFTAAVGMGIWMAVSAEKLVGYHPVIGIIIFGLASFQAVGGVVAHLKYRKQQRPVVEGTLHRYSGLFLITLGIINGGLGLLYGGGAISRSEAIAYGVIAGFIWVAFMGFSVGMAAKRKKEMEVVEKTPSQPSTTTT